MCVKCNASFPDQCQLDKYLDVHDSDKSCENCHSIFNHSDLFKK